MEVLIFDTPATIGCYVADLIQAVLGRRPEPVLGLATGSSPGPTYTELIRRHRDDGLSFAHARAFSLDEYLGLPADHEQSYRQTLRRELIDHVDLPLDRLVTPVVDALEVPERAEQYDAAIAAAGGVDLQLLGIGSDGHIGFNEPVSSLGSRTRIKTLTDETRHDNARFFGGDAEAVPRHVITQGIGTILEARRLVLIATGAGKADAVAAAVEGPLTSMVPASALQLHPSTTVLVDPAAASALSRRDYYETVQRHKPSWQR